MNELYAKYLILTWIRDYNKKHKKKIKYEDISITPR
jgi:hypothetical protein